MFVFVGVDLAAGESFREDAVSVVDATDAVGWSIQPPGPQPSCHLVIAHIPPTARFARDRVGLMVRRRQVRRIR